MTVVDQTLVSVLIPVYNMGEFIEAAISSVLDGGYQYVEILIIDDGSTDDTKQLVEPYVNSENVKFDSRVQYFYKLNGGKSSALNLGLKYYKGAYFTILDADDCLSVRALHCRAEAVNKFKNSKSMIIGSFEVFENDTVVGRRPAPHDISAEQLSVKFYFSLKTPFHLNASLISRPLADSVGLFDTKLIRCQDGDYAIRCLQRTEILETTDKVVYRYRKHRESRADRVKFRLRTAKHRMRVLNNNFDGPQKVLMLLGCLMMDGLKLGYEMFGNFKS